MKIITKHPDFDPVNFAMWTSINLSTCIDFIHSIIDKHGDIRGDYDSLANITEALKMNREYAEKFRKYWSEDDA